MPWQIIWKYGAGTFKWVDLQPPHMPRLIQNVPPPAQVNIDLEALAGRVADLVTQKLLALGAANLPTAYLVAEARQEALAKNPVRSPAIEIDSTLLDVGVDTSGLQKAKADPVGTTTRQDDNLGALKSKLGELKRK